MAVLFCQGFTPGLTTRYNGLSLVSLKLLQSKPQSLKRCVGKQFTLDSGQQSATAVGPTSVP